MCGEDPVLTDDAMQRDGLIPEWRALRENHDEVEVGVVKEQFRLA